MAVAAATRRRVALLPRTRAGRSRLFGYLLLTPALLYIVALVGVPFLLALSYSVSDVTTANLDGGFVGLKNFQDLLRDPAFRQALGNTLIYTTFSIILNAILGTCLAFVLLADFVGKRLVRFLLLLPWTIPIALTILSWKWMLDPQYSVINWLGSWTLPLDPPISAVNWVGQALNLITGPSGIQWLGQPVTAMASVIFVNVWRNFPFTAIIILAGLTAIPPEIIEAARLDGAGPITRYRAIILPMIAPILLIGLLFNLVFTISDLTIVYLLTLGGPAGATEVLGTYAFKVGINSGDLGHGAATSLFLFPVLAVFSIVFLRQLRTRDR